MAKKVLSGILLGLSIFLVFSIESRAKVNAGSLGNGMGSYLIPMLIVEFIFCLAYFVSGRGILLVIQVIMFATILYWASSVLSGESMLHALVQ